MQFTKTGSVLGNTLDSDDIEITIDKSLAKKKSILDNTTQLHVLLVRQQTVFSWRLLQLQCNKNRHRKSFIPTGITVCNDSTLCREYLRIVTIIYHLLFSTLLSLFLS